MVAEARREAVPGKTTDIMECRSEDSMPLELLTSVAAFSRTPGKKHTKRTEKEDVGI